MPDLLTGHEPKPTRNEMVMEIKREIAMRERVFPRWVEAGKIKAYDAEYRIRVMRAILEALGND